MTFQTKLPCLAHPKDPSSTFAIAIEKSRWHVPWGQFDAIGSPSFWIHQAHQRGSTSAHQWRQRSLEEELVFCLLGGFGVTAESADVAHRAIMPMVRAMAPVDADAIRLVLSQPLADGRRYRFPNQRSDRIAAAVNQVRSEPSATDGRALRTQLLALKGVGLKTASWIARNCTGSDEVAIVDIWLARAMARCGVFRSTWHPQGDYLEMESAFLQYAQAGDVAASELDICIWEMARVVFPALSTKGTSEGE